MKRKEKIKRRSILSRIMKTQVCGLICVILDEEAIELRSKQKKQYILVIEQIE